jgi:hypothetical protein
MPTREYTNFEKRSIAADCYLQANEDAEVAAELLKDRLGARQTPCRPKIYCEFWGKRRLTTHNVADAPRSGAPRRLSQQQIDVAITALSQGWLLLGANEATRKPYSSWLDFCTNCPTASNILQSTGVHPRHLLRACKATLPTLKRAKIQLRVWLKPATKAERVSKSQTLLGMTDGWFQSVVWVDAKTLYISPKSAFAWINTADMMAHSMLVREDRRIKPKPSQMVKIKFYIAVNAMYGPVAMVFTTGTTGMTADRANPPYTVSLTYDRGALLYFAL